VHVLLTGAAGFIGAAVAERLAALGHTVFGIDNLNDYYPVQLKVDRLARLGGSCGNAFRFSETDFGDIGALELALGQQHFDRIVHLGAQAGVRYSLENAAAYVRSNLVGHANMLEIARHRAVRHMVYASSSSVYGNRAQTPFGEHDRADRPVSLYAATKRADELLSESYAHLYRLPLTGLRFFTVYGPWGRPDMMPWIFTAKVLAGETIPVFNRGEMYRDFTFIDDIVDGVVACTLAPPADDGREKPGGSTGPHAIYNIGNNRPEHLLRVIEVIENACGRKAEIELLPMQPGDVERTCADIEAMRRDFGYRPSTAIETGFAAFVAWFKTYHAL
jgi:UDP-glucuronate 4-epimerase